MNKLSYPEVRAAPVSTDLPPQSPRSGRSPIRRFAGGLGTLILALVGAVVILLSLPHLLTLVGVVLLSGAILLAFRIYQPLGWTLSGLTMLVSAAIVISQALATTPPITDVQGNVVPGSIAALEKVNLDGTDQWIVIRGKSTANPVLLFLSGGPGGTELGWFRYHNAPLEDKFTVIIWEQPGAGKSYGARPYSQITVDRMVEDGRELTLRLARRFGQDKIYLLGHSWGSVLGVKMVQRYPELFHAYIGVGQMVNTTENDILAYNYVLEQAQLRGDTQTLERFKGYGSPPYDGMLAGWKYVTYLGQELAYEGEAAGPPESTGGSYLDTPEFGLLDKLYFFRGLVEGLNEIYVKQLRDLDFEKQASQLQVPVYLMVGRHDYNSNWVLSERWFNKLQAPDKELVWFERSGHSPLYTEPGKFNSLMVTKVLAETYPR